MLTSHVVSGLVDNHASIADVPAGTGDTAPVRLLPLNVLERPLAAGDVLVARDDERRVVAVVLVEILEGAVCCNGVRMSCELEVESMLILTSLGVEEVDDRHEGCVEHGEDDPELPADVLDTDGGDFDNDKVGKPARCQQMGIILNMEAAILPVGRCRHGRTLRPHGNGIDLSGIQPRNTQHAQAKGNVVKEEEDNRRLGCFDAAIRRAAVPEKNSDDEKGKTLPGSREQHQASAAPSLDQRDGEAGED